MDMYQHQGLAWVVGAQATIRLYRRCLEAPVTPRGVQNKEEVLAAAIHLSNSYTEEKAVIDTSLANPICSALKVLGNVGNPSFK
eukprot:11305223-Karenia_brevis.AAC.1